MRLLLNLKSRLLICSVGTMLWLVSCAQGDKEPESRTLTKETRGPISAEELKKLQEGFNVADSPAPRLLRLTGGVADNMAPVDPREFSRTMTITC